MLRNLIGGIVLAAGIGGTGYYATVQTAPAIEARIQAASDAVLSDSRHGATARVSGRDIRVTGRFHDDDEVKALTERLGSVSGHRVIDMSGVSVLPAIAPYELFASRDETGWQELSGMVPSDVMAVALVGVTGLPTDAVTLASGEPDENWPIAFMIGLDALGPLERGSVALTGQALIVTGVALTPTEQAASAALLADLPEGYSAEIRIETLDDGTPFRLAADWDGSALTGSGKVPQGFDFGVAGDVEQSVLEDEAWPLAAQLGVDALRELVTGRLVIDDTALTLTGAATPTGRDRAEVMLASLPDGYGATVQVSLYDDGTPFRLEAVRGDGADRVSGKLPAGADPMALIAPLGGGGPDLARSYLDDPDGIWPGIAEAGVAALAHLETGTLTIEAAQLTLTGEGTPEGIAAAEAALANLPAGADASYEMTLYDDGIPFSLMAAFDGDEATIAGRLPDGMAQADLAEMFGGIPVTGELEQSYLSDTGGWQARAEAGLAALAQLQEGALSVIGEDVILTGTARTPDEGAAITAGLNGAQVTLYYLDDGSPPDWHLTYGAATGATLAGKLPAGLLPSEIAARLGVETIDGDPEKGFVTADMTDALTALAAVADYLPEIEKLDLDLAGASPVLDMTMSPGVDTELVALDLSARIPVTIDFRVSDLQEMPAIGDERVNAATGLRERFRGAAWLPALDFTASKATCAEQASVVLGGGGVAFLSGEARLDATSVRAINTVTAIVLKCIDEADLELQVAGHTDSSGDPVLNQQLSEARALAVRDALVARGVPPERITAAGYGASVPVADNETEEGRAANRRTEMEWFAPGDP